MTHQIVAIQRDVERAGRHVVAVDVVQRPRDPAGQRHTARANSDERNVVKAAIALEDFVSNPGQRPPHPVRVHYERHTSLRHELEIARLT
jgi:hypothetical protein